MGIPENNAGIMAKRSTHLTQHTFDAADTSRIIEMVWEDRTPFEAIKVNYGLGEAGVIHLMRRELKASSYRMWRKRVVNRVTKHAALRVHRKDPPTPPSKAEAATSPGTGRPQPST